MVGVLFCLIVSQDSGHFDVGAIYSVVFITLGPFIFVNLIIGVVCANLGEAYDELEKTKKARYRRLKGHADISAPSNRTVVNVSEVRPDFFEKQIPYEVPVR